MKPSWLNDISNIYADKELSAFQKVLVVKALRPDYLHTALSKLAAKQLGKCHNYEKLFQISRIFKHFNITAIIKYIYLKNIQTN